MRGGEFALHQMMLRVATTLEQIRLICDRTHEENILAAREGRPIDVACHYAYAMGTVMAVVTRELDQLQADGLRRVDHEIANQQALASLAAFQRSVAKLQEDLQQ